MDCFFGGDHQFFAAPFYCHSFSETVALRIYLNNQPHNLKIAPLQKGLILCYNSAEIVGEGAGFGVPIARYDDETYFSGTSTLQVNKTGSGVVIQKEYLFDLVARNHFHNLKLENRKLQRQINTLNALYQRNKPIAHVTLKLKPILNPLCAHSGYAKVAPRGKAVATYTIENGKINVDICFSQLHQRGLEQLMVLNEQAAHFFRKYSDSQGLLLRDGDIGVWDTVDAVSAVFSAAQNRCSFRLKAVEGAKMRRGREAAAGYLDWAGLDYELPPNTSEFSYDITVSGAN